jgi:uncharacterized phage protein (TIGR01671 family)
MKREIKFRAWDGEKMRYPNMISFSDNGGDSSTCYTIDELEPEYFHAEVMQYTGLKDKNGKEIYEGDIVKTGNRIAKVVWQEYACKYILQELAEGKSYLDWFDYKNMKTDGEVIGNVFETPSLLTNQEK